MILSNVCTFMRFMYIIEEGCFACDSARDKSLIRRVMIKNEARVTLLNKLHKMICD